MDNVKKRSMNIPIFIPHLGCPNDCVFCNQRQISGESKEEREEKALRDKIESYLQTGVHRENIEIAFFGGSFTGIDPNVQSFYLDIASEYVDKYRLKGIRMSTRPDYISTEILDFLKAYPISAIELGVQSLDQKVLDLSKRNHRVEDVYEAVDNIRKYHIELGLQVMLGLPGDTAETFKSTIDQIINIGPTTLRIYPTLVIEHTELEELYQHELYHPMSLASAVEQVADVLPKLNEANIKVIRIGLQANEELNTQALVAGPYHPAFGELVIDRCVYNELIDYVRQDREKIEVMGARIMIKANDFLMQRLIGHKKENKERITRFFDENLNKKLIFQLDRKMINKNIQFTDDINSLSYSLNGIGF